MDKVTLQKIEKYIDEQLDIKKTSIGKRCERIHKTLHLIQTQYYFPEVSKMAKLECDLKEQYGKLFKHYKYNDNHTWDKKGEIESQVYCDPKYLSIYKKFRESETIVKHIERMMNNLQSATHTIRNYINAMSYLGISE